MRLFKSHVFIHIKLLILYREKKIARQRHYIRCFTPGFVKSLLKKAGVFIQLALNSSQSIYG